MAYWSDVLNISIRNSDYLTVKFNIWKLFLFFSFHKQKWKRKKMWKKNQAKTRRRKLKNAKYNLNISGYFRLKFTKIPSCTKYSFVHFYICKMFFSNFLNFNHTIVSLIYSLFSITFHLSYFYHFNYFVINIYCLLLSPSLSSSLPLSLSIILICFFFNFLKSIYSSNPFFLSSWLLSSLSLLQHSQFTVGIIIITITKKLLSSQKLSLNYYH